MVASACRAAGLWLGDRLIPPTESNPLGHFEDLDFYDVNRRALLANDEDEDGLSVPGRLVVPSALEAEAAALVRHRTAQGRPWGWKDPRTTLLLEFWAKRIPDAKFLLLFRRPWDVIDSLYRRGDVAIRRNPHLALDLWCDYNERICRFAATHPDRVLVREAAQFVTNPVAVLRSVEATLGVPLRVRRAVYRKELFHQLPEDDFRSVFHDCAPHALAVYQRLRHLAGQPPTGSRASRSEGRRFLGWGLFGWAFAARRKTLVVSTRPSGSRRAASGRAA